MAAVHNTLVLPGAKHGFTTNLLKMHGYLLHNSIALVIYVRVDVRGCQTQGARIMDRRTILGGAVVGVGAVTAFAGKLASGQVHEPPGIAMAELHSASFEAGDLGDRRSVDMFLDARTSHRWTAASGAIGHQRGGVHTNGVWWNDPCNNFQGWTCYGPYVNLERGTYSAQWFLSAETTGGAGHDLGVDVVGLVANYRILNEQFFNIQGSSQEGNAVVNFTLFDDIDKVEVRLRSHTRAKLLIAKELRIIQTNA